MKEVKATYPLGLSAYVAIYDIIYDIVDKVKFTWVVNGKKSKISYARLRVDSEGRGYFLTHNYKVILSECIWCKF